MDTSPPEGFMRPEPFPSVSTPACPVHPLSVDAQPYTYSHGCSEGEDLQEAFDRISGILSTLLQEANNAIKEEDSAMLPFKSPGTSMMPKSGSLSRPSRPARLHGRHSSGSTLSAFEPLSPASSVSTLINDDDDDEDDNIDDDDDNTVIDEEDGLLFRARKQRRSIFFSRSPSPSLPIHRKRHSFHQHQGPAKYILPTRRFSAPPRRRDPLAESYKRLDSSMAVVDSLSRDLASEAKDEGAAEQQRKQDPQSALRLTALLILPFLHIPHALITTIFDSLTTSDSNNFAGVLAWGLFFALANVMINKVIRPKTLTAFVTTRSVAVGPFPWATTPPPATTAAATASDAMRQSPPGSNLNHHHPTLYRRRRVIRRPSVYRTKPTIPLSPTSAGLIRSRTQPGESLKQQQLLPSVPQQQFRPVVKRRNSF